MARKHEHLRDPRADWFKSSYSNGTQNCVEVRTGDDAVATRDSKMDGGPALVFPATSWAAFISGLSDG
ncbi:DUF397 domain-containing protein [Streptomyces albus]|uniref:DUF397 domain-containing protein n=1 Tax=Streptomyces albus TaxID=1888 RepID=UPI0036F65113